MTEKLDIKKESTKTTEFYFDLNAKKVILTLISSGVSNLVLRLKDAPSGKECQPINIGADKNDYFIYEYGFFGLSLTRQQSIRLLNSQSNKSKIIIKQSDI